MSFAMQESPRHNMAAGSISPEDSVPLFQPVAPTTTYPSQRNASQSSPSTNRSANASTGPQRVASLQFVNISNPNDSRKKEIMKQVRRQAMIHTLKTQKGGQQFTKTAATRQPNQTTPDVESARSRKKKTRLDTFTQPFADTASEPDSLLLANNNSKNKPVLAESPAVANSASSRRSPESENARKILPIEESPHLYHPPLASRRFELDPFKSEPTSANSSINTLKLKRNFVTFFGSEGLSKCWGPIAAVDELFYLSSLCISARHTDILLNQIDNRQTVSLENQVLRMVRLALANPETRKADSTITGILFIACANLYSAREQTNVVQWYNMVLDLIRSRGGLEALRPGEPALAVLILINALCAPLIREETPRAEFIEYGKSMLGKIEGLPIRLESPVCYPRFGFKFIPKSKHCSPMLLSLLQQMRYVSELFIADGPTEYQPTQYSWQKDHIQSVLDDFPSATAAGHECSFDFYYESCRIASLIQECALYNKLSFADVGASTDYVTQLLAALKKTKLEDCWDDLAGVLLWVLLIGACAANRTPERLWIVATMIRVNMKISFEYGDITLRTVYKLLQLQNFNCFSYNPGLRTSATPPVSSSLPQSVMTNDSRVNQVTMY